MKHAFAFVVAGLLFVPAVLSQRGDDQEQAVLRAFRTLDDAGLKRYRTAMERSMAPDYVYIHSDGSMTTKAEEIADMMAETPGVTQSATESLRVRIYGDAAVITGIYRVRDAKNPARSGTRRFTEFLVKRNGAWLSVGGQSTIMSAK